GDRLDEARGDVVGAIEIYEANEVLGELDAVRAFAFGEEILLEMRVPHVRDARQSRAVLAPVVDGAGKAAPAEIDTVVRALARYEDVASALASRLMIGERDLHRGVDGFGSRV